MNRIFRELRPLIAGWAILTLLGSLARAELPSRRQIKEDLLRAAAEEYVDALNRGDLKAVAEYWTAEGDLVDETGQLFKGRELAAAADEQRDERAKLTVTLDSIRFPADGVAVVEGTSRLSPPPKNRPAAGRFTAVWIAREGRWLLDVVREAPLAAESPRRRLESVAWMIGEWQAEAGGAEIRLSCDWSPDGNFMLREIRIQAPDRPEHVISQRIGWDAAAGAIRSWNFDSDGGYSEGDWSPEGKAWKVTSTGVRPDGERVNSVSVYTPVSDDEFTWESSEGAAKPHPAIRIVRRSKRP